MISMKKVRFSSRPTAKVRCHRPLGAARVQLALYHLWEQNQGLAVMQFCISFLRFCRIGTRFYQTKRFCILKSLVNFDAILHILQLVIFFCAFFCEIFHFWTPLIQLYRPCLLFCWGFLHVYRSPLYWDFTVTIDTCQLSHFRHHLLRTKI